MCIRLDDDAQVASIDPCPEGANTLTQPTPGRGPAVLVGSGVVLSAFINFVAQGLPSPSI